MLVDLKSGSGRADVVGDFEQMTLIATTDEEKEWLAALDSIFRRGGKLEITPVRGERIAVEFDEGPAPPLAELD